MQVIGSPVWVTDPTLTYRPSGYGGPDVAFGTVSGPVGVQPGDIALLVVATAQHVVSDPFGDAPSYRHAPEGDWTPVDVAYQQTRWYPDKIDSFYRLEVFTQPVSGSFTVTVPWLEPDPNWLNPNRHMAVAVFVVRGAGGVGASLRTGIHYGSDPDVVSVPSALGALMVTGSWQASTRTDLGVALTNGEVHMSGWAFRAYARTLDAVAGTASYSFAGQRSVNETVLLVEIFPQLDPSPPTLVAPSGQVAGGTAEVRLTHRPVGQSTGASAAFVAVTTGGVERWWTGSGWSTSETSVAVSGFDVVVPVSLAVGTSGTWRAATRDATTGRKSGYSATSSWQAVAAPVVTSMAVSCPAGTLTPTVTWATDVAAPLWRIRLMTGTGGVLDQWTGSTGSPVVLPARAWTNGTTYTVELVAMLPSGVGSEPTTRTVMVSWTPPSPPTLSAVLAGRAVQVTATAADPAHLVEVQRWLVDGWEPVAATVGRVEVADRLLPFGPVTYRSRSSVSTWVTSTWVVSASVLAADRCDLLVDADGLVLPCRMADEGPHVWPSDVDELWPDGAFFPFVSRSAPRARRGQVVLRVESPAARDQVITAFRRTVRMRLPVDKTVVGEILTVTGVSSQVSVARLVNIPNPKRHVVIDWVEQPGPPRDPSNPPS